MSKKITMEVFRAGKQTDSMGNTKEWTEADLDKMVKQFSELGEDVPATIGHNETNAPAFGWFKKVFRKGDTLFAELSDIVDEFGVMLKNRMFKNRSIALRNDFSLRHIAFLGAEAPAVKGLKDFAFKSKEEFKEFEFSIDEMITNENLKDKILKLWPNFGEKKEIKKPGIKPDNGGHDMEFKEQAEKLEAEKIELNKKIAGLETSNTEFSENLKKSEAEVKVLKDEKELAFAEAKAKDYNEFAEGLIKSGKAIPAHKATIIAMQKTLDGQEAIDFAEGNETVKKTPLEIYRASLESKDINGLFGEKFSEEAASPAQAIQKQIDDKIAGIQKDQGVNFSEASKILNQTEPKLMAQLTLSEEQ